MGKEKASVLENSTTKHRSSAAKKTSSKRLSYHLEDIDSLSCLKQKKSVDIDDKLNLLKSELQSLFYNPKSKTNCESRAQTVEKTDALKKHKETTNRPKSSKFSEWLSETIDEMDTKSKNSKMKNDLKFNSLLSSPQLKIQSKDDVQIIPKCNVERLLYQSLQLKYLTHYTTSSDEDEEEQFQSKKKKKRIRRSAQSISAFPSRNKRKRKVLKNDVEVISVEDNSENEQRGIDCIDLVSYDWSEPFSSSASENLDLEIIEEEINIFKKTDSTARTQEPKTNNFTSPSEKRAWECPICFESSQGQTIVATHCGHVFCQECLEKHNATKGKDCPTCRFDLSSKVPITLFNL